MELYGRIKSMYVTSFKGRKHQGHAAQIKKIRLGICAMDKKAKSKPMREILSRLPEELFEVIIFGDECILNTPPESWPVVEVLIAFYSSRYPTEKALQYVKLRKPFMVNDLEMDATLKDRRKVYDLLQANGIEVPVHVYCNRDADSETDSAAAAVPVVEEFDEYIVVNGVQINKPLVEKPVDAEDHNIYIYYPMSAGGGSKRLFRKVDDRSSEFYPRVHELRKEGSFIYEEFLVTQGTDVKVYTVGTDYGHAEARKSPVVDGRVNRDQAGLEVRYPVILSHTEKDMARKIVTAFKQTVCGFDILRVHGRSFCCDVNGFSFVKNSRKYYDDATQVLTEMMIGKCRPELLAHPSTKSKGLPSGKHAAQTTGGSGKHHHHPSNVVVPNINLTKQNLAIFAPKPIRDAALGGRGTPPAAGTGTGATQQGTPSPSLPEDASAVPVPAEQRRDDEAASMISVSRRGSQDNLLGDRGSNDDDDTEELRCVIAVIRHGDRTPKQKMKVRVSEPKFLDYFHTFAKTPRKDLKVKSRSALVRFLEVTREIIADGTVSPDQDPDLFRKLRQIRDVLERWEISGINRKLQMKPQKWTDDGGLSDVSSTPLPPPPPPPPLPARDHAFSTAASDNELNLNSPADFPLPPVAPAPSSTASEQPQKAAEMGKATEVLLILKWGGDLTPLGREQAELMGARFRHEMYPDNAGGGVLRLHATYRHDLKIKASDEGRVMKTAAAFTKGLLELEGQLTPILASLVTIEEKNRQMLDRGGNLQIKEDMDRCKEHLNLLQVDREMDAALVDQIASPGCPKPVRAAMLSLGNPLRTLQRLHQLIADLCTQLKRICDLQEREAEEKARRLSGGGGGGGGGGGKAASTAAAASAGNQSDGSLPRNSSLESNEANPPFPHSQVGEQHDLPGVVPAHPQQHVLDNRLYLSETFSLMLDRWEKLNKDFFSPKTGKYDLTKVPDVYDMIRYDVLHNSHLELDPPMHEIYSLAAALENSIVPQEYGQDGNEKRVIGSKVCGALLEKIRYDLTMARESGAHDMNFLLDRSHAEDLEINSLTRAVRTRLYFTSESHLHTLLNALRYTANEGDVCAIDTVGLEKLDSVAELSYLTQIVFRLFESREDPNVSRCEISFSPGATNDPFTDKSSALAPYITLSSTFNQQEMLQAIGDAIHASNADCSPSPRSQATTSFGGGNMLDCNNTADDASSSSSTAVAAASASSSAAAGANAGAGTGADLGIGADGDGYGVGSGSGSGGGDDDDGADVESDGFNNSIAQFVDTSPYKPSSSAAASHHNMPRPPPIRRTQSITVVSDNLPADPWESSWQQQDKR